MSKIELKQVSKSYDSKKLSVKDFSLTIQDGEFIVLVGPSGCGKSTTLRMIAGLEKISSGELFIDQEKSNDLPPQKRNLAMVFQEYALYPNMNVFNNLAYPLKIEKIPKETIHNKVNEVAELLNISDLLKRKPRQLSGGQKQRVALGRAIIRKPTAFLMDEPLSNLDAKLRVQMRYEIAQLHRRLATTFIYVTHDQTEAMTMGDRIVVMNQGEIQQVGTPTEIYDQPKNIFVAEFLGTPKMNMMSADQAQSLMTNLKHKTAIIGIRPENLKIEAGDDYQVKFIENLGNEQYIYLENAVKESLIATTSNNQQIFEDQKVSVKIKSSEKIYYFDAISTERIN